MNARVLGYSVCGLVCLFLAAGSRVPEEPDQVIRNSKRLRITNTEIHILSPDFSNQLDIPIINPTPTIAPTNPYITASVPPPPNAYFTPVTPTPTTPTYTTPTYTNPTTPFTTTPTTSSGSWCIASPTAPDTTLQVALDYACGYGGADCSAIQPGASCYNPNTLRDHASYAFNNHYQKLPTPMSCVFGGAAQLTSTDPSTSSCHYPQSSSSSTIPSISSPPPPTTMTPVTPYTPVTPTTPAPTTPTVTTPTTDYAGEEPVGDPSSATSLSSSILLLFATSIIALLLEVQYF